MEPSDRQRRVRRQQWIKLAVFLSLITSLLVGLVVIDGLLVSFVIAVVCSYLVAPLVSYLEGAGLSRLVSIIIVFCFFSTLLGVAIWAAAPFMVDQFVSLKESLPRYVDGAVRLIDDFAHTLNSISGGLANVDLSVQVREWLTSQSSLLVEGLPGVLSSSASVLFLSPLLGFFIMKDGRQIGRELLRLVPNNLFELTLNLQHQISDQIGQFIRARLLESIIVGLVVLVGLAVMGFPYAVILAVFAALTNLIPYIGPIVGAAPGLVIALVNHGSGITLALVLFVYALAQIIDMFFIIPLVVARIVNLHPLTVILVVILGAEFMGVLGMLISIPVASTIKVTFSSIYQHLTDYTG